MRNLIWSILLLVAASTSNATDNWPQFRGPTGDGISTAKGVVRTWSEQENIRWKTSIRDKGWSSPVIWGKQVWLTTGLKSGKELFAIGINRDTGEIQHEIKLFEDPNPAFCIDYNSYASPTGAIEEGRFYAHFGVHGTACIDTQSGKVLWSRKDIPCNHFRGPGSSVLLHQNKLILTFDGFDLQYLIALDKETGKTIWRTDRNIAYTTDNGDYKKAYSTPSIFTVNGKLQLVSPAAEATLAFNPDTGEELWRIHHGGMNEAAKPIAGHGLLYLTSGHTGQLLAVKLADAKGKRPAEDILWKSTKGIPTRPSLLLHENYLYLISDKGFASCLDAKTGKQMWQERLGGDFCASPVWIDGAIYLSDEAGTTHVLAAEPEFRPIAKNKLDIGCMGSLAVAGDAIYLRSKTHLYCIGIKK